ncbi:hypothetical protein ACFWPV_16025 [Streptomyces uncialis]|uniref:hypothetical protein n=1 Tax=Streptomyces uncialis TaxID=1048205 RepID=UPI003668EA80
MSVRSLRTSAAFLVTATLAALSVPVPAGAVPAGESRGAAGNTRDVTDTGPAPSAVGTGRDVRLAVEVHRGLPAPRAALIATEARALATG